MVAEPHRVVGLIGAYVRANVLSILQFRANFLLGVVAISSRHIINLLTLWVVFVHTRALGDWQPFEVLYLYGYVSLVIAVWHAFFANTLRVEFLVRDAGFDRYLTRPLPAVFQLMFHYFDDDALGDFIPAFACIGVASYQLGLRYTPYTLLIFLVGVAGGALIHFGIHLLLSSWSFWFVKSRALINLFSDVRRFSEYPLDIFPLGVQWVLTVILPIAFAGFYPAEQILSPESLSRLAWLTLPVGLVVCGIGMSVWHAGLARYQSTGS